MKHLDLIGTELKSDFLCDLFETYDVDVVYAYDRTHENLPDEYQADIPELGLQFVFDEHQVLKTLFMKPLKATGYNPFDKDDERLPCFRSKDDAIYYASDKGERYSEGKADFMGEKKDWIRLEYAGYSVHYEFVDGKLRMITMQIADA